MDNIILNTHLDKMLDYVYRNSHLYDNNTLNYNLRLKISDFVEQVLLFNKVVFKIDFIIYPLVYLINEVGVITTRKYLESEPIKFIVWTPHFFHGMKDEPKVSNNGELEWPALLAGIKEQDLNLDKIFNDSLQYVKTKLSKDDESFFKTYFILNTSILNLDSANTAIEYAKYLYKSNLLKPFDIIFDNDLSKNFTQKEVEDLTSITMEIYTSTVIVEKQLKGYNFNFLPKLHREFATLYGFKNSPIENNSKLLEINNIPNFKSLYLNNQLSIKKILHFANTEDSLKYKKWLSVISNEVDSKEVSKYYLNFILNKKGFFETTKGKFVKTIGFWGVGGLVGSILAGIPGAIVGASIGNISEKTFDLSLGMFENFYLDKLTQKWSPKIYFDQLDEIWK